MNVNVNQFDDKKAKAVLKTCPKIVRDYVKLIEEQSVRWQELTKIAIKKIKEQSKGL